MSLFANYRADRLIAEVKSSGNPGSPLAQKALEKLVALGSDAIEPLVEALSTSEKRESTAYVEALSKLIDSKTLPHLLKTMSEANGRAMTGVAWALSSSRNYPPSALLEALTKQGMPKQAIIDVIAAQKSRFTVRELLNAAYAQEPTERTGLFKIIGEIADESSVDDLIARIEGKDPVARLHIINVLGRFNLPKVSQAVQKQLKDSNKFIRSAALSALANMDGPFDMPLITGLLRDPEIEVQNKAVDVVVKANHPETVKYLVDVLKDENEYARRAAVEVLNVVGTSKSVKYLLEVIADSDWWVRTRAADALGKIGGPRVVDAVLALIKDENQDIRRAAIEILNQTKDERAVAQLLEATKDPDWWVSERAVDALAEIGSSKSLPRFIEMLQGEPKSLPTVIRAIGKIGDQKSLEHLLPMLNRPENEIKVEAISALAKLTDERRAETVRVRLQSVSTNNDGTVSQAVARALLELDNRFSTQQIAANQRAQKMQEPAKTLLIDNVELAKVVRQNEETAASAKLDIATLKPGDVIEGRYKFIEKIGKGAFGTVLLMEDTVVEERLILKFLNPNVSSDEEMMKRFVHELRYSRKITHKNVIRIYDFLYIRGNYAISMEYFPSHTLGGEIVNEKPVALKRAVKFAVDIATGMAVAHQAGIVHRDLKPANVLIDNDLLLKIVDFGVAAAQTQGDTQLTKTGYVIGSPKYMAPEQILGKKVDERADIYSLGVIMYEMFSGIPPYSRGDHMSVMYQHVQGKARPPIEINKDLPMELNNLVMRCMSLDKAKRAQSMDELRLSLEKFL
ncbi:MAG TPA: HEAT repeat domain-containing protein [Steroidobacteraceae bacterium]|jgi:HEAT repeat protein/tRNA A-37 threonylcarbamoyl transferase component Bud32|nr:HEAT repeat domain-containing protein [Steroidobacteraceae bacterium]